MQYTQNAVAVQPNKPLICLRTSIMTIGIIGLIIWMACFGMSAGFCFDPYATATTRFIGFLLVVVHTAYIFLTCEIIYFISYVDTFSHSELTNLRSATSKLLAATITGVGVSVSIILHFIMYGFEEGWYFEWRDDSGSHHFGGFNNYSASYAFWCSFSYIYTSILFILIAVYYKKCHTRLMYGGLPKHQQLPVTQYPVATAGMPQRMEMTGMSQQMETAGMPQWMATPAPANPEGPTFP
ncbi:uncharacterized protein LOC135205335 isoform X2 [Macrobrachium nipponense]